MAGEVAAFEGVLGSIGGAGAEGSGVASVFHAGVRAGMEVAGGAGDGVLPGELGSQKKALPRAMAAVRFLTKFVRVVGSGTGTILRDWSWRERPRTVRLALAKRPTESMARAVRCRFRG